MEARLTRRTRARRIKLRPVHIVIIALTLAAALLALLSVRMRPAFTALATARIKSIAARAMNDAILDSMGSESGYADLIEVRDTGSHVYMLSANTRGMNLLAAECAEAAQDRIADLGEQGLTVPLGTLTGVSFLSGYGPGIRIAFTPMGSVKSEFDSEFVSSGINQTLYRVTLRLTASIKLVLPGVADSISVEAEAAIAESILVGEVPQVYTDVANNEDMLNLIPTEPMG